MRVMAGKKEGMSDEDWRRVLTQGETGARVYRRAIRNLPSNPRCKMCLSPFAGVGGYLGRLTGNGPSRKNPAFCRGCFEAAPIGGAEAEIGVLFADVRGYTSLAEKRAPHDVAALMNRFYDEAANVLSHHDAVIDKLVGDEVMALFIPGFAGPDYVRNMLGAAERLLRSVGFGTGSEPWLMLGIGLDAGVAYVGNVGSGEVKDFTALGDVVNTAARLQSQAKSGQILMSQRVYDSAMDRFPDAPAIQLDLKGKSEPVLARVIDIAHPQGEAREP